jgi:hypothetical protein
MDSTKIHSNARRRLREQLVIPRQAHRGQRLTAPRVIDRPRLIGWSSLDLVRSHL